MRFESCSNHCDISGEGLSLRSMPFISTMYFTLARAVSKTVLQSSAMSIFFEERWYTVPMVSLWCHLLMEEGSEWFNLKQVCRESHAQLLKTGQYVTTRLVPTCCKDSITVQRVSASRQIDRYSHDDVVYNIMSECQGQRVNMCIHMHTVSYSNLCI